MPIRIIHFCPWAGRLQDAAEFLRELPRIDIRPKVSNPADPALMRMACLDCDWHAETVRAFAAVNGMPQAAKVERVVPSALEEDNLQFMPAWTFGLTGAADLLQRPRQEGEEWWIVITGQHPDLFKDAAGRLFAACVRRGFRLLYYAFDEASRTLGVFKDIAPHLDVYIHDESPIHEPMLGLFKPDCRLVHRSWVANLVPFSAPFPEAPEEKIVFLGSKLGLTPHRRRQIDFLRKRYGSRFVAICDHSLPVSDRARLGRYKVSLCPEGRKFGVPSMSATHTDRPFWSGCLGMIPVSEDSREGGRLQSLHEAGLILRYPHGDLSVLAAVCDQALACPSERRLQIYNHFNRNETVGGIVAAEIAAPDLAPARAS